MRRSGYDTRSDARTALGHVLECERAGVYVDDAQTVADYLVGWLEAKTRRLKPTTAARYRDYLRNDLMPAFGAVRLERLSHQHVDQFVRTQLAAGRGPVTLRRCVATLSSALNDAIRQHRLTHNAARYTTIPRPHRAERPCWTIAANRHVPAPLPPDRRPTHRTVRTAHLHRHAQRRSARPALGRRRPEQPVAVRAPHPRRRRQQPAGLHRTQDHRQPRLDRAIDRAVNALRQRDRRNRTQAITGPTYHDQGLVFCRPDGQPLRPEQVLRHFHELTDAAGLPQVRVHDLRHLAATIMITSGVPLAMVSKTLRHSTLSTTVDIYGHLTRQAAQDAVDATATALDKLNAPRREPRRKRASVRPHCDHNGLNRQLLICPQRHISSSSYVGTAGFEPTTP